MLFEAFLLSMEIIEVTLEICLHYPVSDWIVTSCNPNLRGWIKVFLELQRVLSALLGVCGVKNLLNISTTDLTFLPKQIDDVLSEGIAVISAFSF